MRVFFSVDLIGRFRQRALFGMERKDVFSIKRISWAYPVFHGRKPVLLLCFQIPFRVDRASLVSKWPFLEKTLLSVCFFTVFSSPTVGVDYLEVYYLTFFNPFFEVNRV